MPTSQTEADAEPFRVPCQRALDFDVIDVPGNAARKRDFRNLLPQSNMPFRVTDIEPYQLRGLVVWSEAGEVRVRWTSLSLSTIGQTIKLTIFRPASALRMRPRSYLHVRACRHAEVDPGHAGRVPVVAHSGLDVRAGKPASFERCLEFSTTVSTNTY